MSPTQTPPRPHGRGGIRERNDLDPAHRPGQGCGETRTPTSTYGTELRTRRPGFIRILSQNIDGIGFRTHSDKLDRLKETCDKYGVDVLALQELNVNWAKVRPNQTLAHRAKHWKEDVRCAVANNTDDQRYPRHQYGGTATIAMDKLAHCYYKSESDFRKLGRWSSMSFRGKGGKITRVVSCYCPVKPTTFHGGSVYTQHVEALQRVGIHKCPRAQFWIDLNSAIARWTEDEETLIIAGDFNHHISACNEKLAGTGLKEFITHTHGLDAAPATHQAGSVPIDGIFVSAALLPFTRGGYMGFAQATVSDHRALWIELPLVTFIGYDMSDIIHPSARRLKLQDPRIVKKYQDTLHQLFTEHKLYDKLAKLAQSVTYPLPPTQQKLYESIDKTRMHCMKTAEKRCRKLRMGNIPYSSAYNRARDEIDLWTSLKKREQGMHIDMQRSLRLMKRLDITDDFYPIEIVQEKLNEAWITYRAVRKDGKKFRQDFIDGLAEAQAEAQNIPQERALKNIQHREAQRDNSKTVKYVLHKLHGGGTSMVIVTRNGVAVELTSKHEIEQALLLENERKYHQTEGFSQLLSGPLLDDIGLLGDGPAVRSILDGSYIVPDGTSTGTRLYLSSLLVPPGANRSRRPYTIDDFTSGWKKMKERTSSHGPAHFGHYKAGCLHKDIAMVHYHMAEIPFSGGYSPIRHRQGTDLVLLKSANDFRIQKLRTIVLFDAECNMNNGRIGREAMNMALSNNMIAPEQYSRPFRRAIDHALNRRLMFDYFSFKKRPHGMTSCDLAGCYDRIIHSAISLALQRVGISPENIESMCKSIQGMLHVVRTAFGDSKQSYGGDDWAEYLLPCMGVFQGNKAGPQIWAIISSTIFGALRKHGFGVKFCSSISKFTFRLCGFAYVDDSDLIADGDTAEATHKKMQETISCWEGLIAATGGAMAPLKSWWYLVDFEWNNGRWRYKNAGENRVLYAHDADNKRHSLLNLSPSQATKMLGVYMSPDGTNTKQVEYMKEKTTLWGTNIRAGNLTQMQSYLALTSTIWKTIEYPLTALDLSQDEVNAVTWPALKPSLRKMGLHPCTAAVIRHGPRNLLGAGFNNPFLTQGVRRLLAIMEQTWHKTPTADLLLTNFEALTLEIGLCGSLFDLPSARPFLWAITPKAWLIATIKFAIDNKIHLDLNMDWLQHAREKDDSLMRAFSHKGYKLLDLLRLNRVRLWYRVALLSDMCTADGTHIDSYPLGRHGHDALGLNRFSKYDWPYQQRPPRTDFKFFRDALRSTFCHDESWKLRQPLGAWIQNDSDYIKDWDWFYSPSLKKLLLRDFEGRFITYLPHPQKRPTRTHLPFMSTSSDDIIEPHIPPDLQRISIKRDTADSINMINCRTRRIPTTPSTPHFDTIDEFCSHLMSTQEGATVAAELSTSPSIDTLIHDFKQGTLVAVSDGSYFKDHPIGAAEWILLSEDETEYIIGGGICPGYPDQLNAYRSELWGLLGISAALWALEKTIGNTTDSVVVGCDGMTALTESLVRNPDGLTAKGKQFDVIAAIMGYWKNISATAIPTWVEGHIEKRLSRDNWPKLNRINYDRDRGAKRIAREGANSTSYRPFHIKFKFGFATLTIDDRRVVSSAERSLLSTLAEAPLQKFWLDKCEISTIHRSKINWTSFKRATGRLPLHRQHFLINWMSRMTIVGSVARTRKIGHQYRCPRCNEWNETYSHVITCIQPRARRLRNTLLDSLKAWFASEDTHPDLASNLYTILFQWSRRPGSFRLPYLYTTDNALVQTIREQHDIGWYNMLLGMQSTGWADIQERYYRSIQDCKKTGTSWASKLQFELWNLVWDMWQHRQEVRRATPTADDILMQNEAREAAIAELHVGRNSLPPLYTIYFSMSTDKLLEKSATDLRAWLRLIRGARESLHIYANDLFAQNGPHRTWLGLRRRTTRLTTTTQPPREQPEQALFTEELLTTGGIRL